MNALSQFVDFASSAKSPSAIDEYLSFFAKPPVYTMIRQYVIFHKGDLGTTLKEKESKLYPRLELINPRANVFRLHLDHSDDKGKDISGVIAILPGKNSNFHRIVTISDANFWKQLVKKIVRRFYPFAMPVFFNQKEIKDSLQYLEKALGLRNRIRVSDVTMKRNISEDSIATKKFETDRRWTELSLDKLFELAIEQNQWFASVKFQIQRSYKNTNSFRTIATGRIYKYGEISYDNLHIEINQNLISFLENHASQRLSLLQGRGIRERNYKPSLPIEITYDQSIFDNKEEIKRFAEMVSSYPNATKAVFHANPYYHSSVADFLDGSSFEVWILSPKRVLLVPQAKSTAQAFERFISHIFNEFREGIIREYSR